MKRVLMGIAILAVIIVGVLAVTIFADKKEEAKTNFDVAVLSGEPEGIAAAVSAARNGMETVLIVGEEDIGGLMTSGMLNFLDVSSDQKGNPANAGIFQEWHEKVGGTIGFDIGEARAAFMEMIDSEKNLTLREGVELSDAVKNGKALTAIEITNESGDEQTITAKRFIDSSKDADLAIAAGAPYFIGGRDIGLEDKKMAVTLMFHFNNVDWDQVTKAAKEGVFGGGGVNGNVAWGFSELHDTYKPHYAELTRLRGLNIVKENDGSVIVNALQIFGVDGLDEAEKQQAIEIGKEETKYILTYLQQNFPGFENAEIESFPDQLYVRETVHVQAEYQLPLSDVWENKDHWDSIGFGAYPVDVQATSPSDYGYVYGKPVQYAIPFRSLVPLEVDNLLVASKASGYSSLAAASARVLPVGMTTGQAAGAASAISINAEQNFRELAEDKAAIAQLQEKLKEQGANLYAFSEAFPYEGEWFYPGIKTLLNYGLIVGGYENQLPVDKPLMEVSFANILSNGIQRINSSEAEKLTENIAALRSLVTEDQQLTRDKAAQMILALQGLERENGAAWDYLVELNMTDDTIYEKLNENKKLTGAEGYYLAALILNDLQ
ncbi:FAD-dependent oxidoreductase [Planococcus versutus]|uniref:Glucose-inhibited division protein A n=1 Tax=Planococcus versutus TaxID=1302659 RepID=A0A1B1S2Z1_9BACL|nr:FAD-dependent oxidoreductase [Planococcus versutus]ANU27519.1 glucose-inhibited division protein A [Planococcus versutus]